MVTSCANNPLAHEGHEQRCDFYGEDGTEGHHRAGEERQRGCSELTLGVKFLHSVLDMWRCIGWVRHGVRCAGIATSDFARHEVGGGARGECQGQSNDHGRHCQWTSPPPKREKDGKQRASEVAVRKARAVHAKLGPNHWLRTHPMSGKHELETRRVQEEMNTQQGNGCETRCEGVLATGKHAQEPVKDVQQRNNAQDRVDMERVVVGEKLRHRRQNPSPLLTNPRDLVSATTPLSKWLHMTRCCQSRHEQR
mmetsp:Transcript_43432/g.114474  ORF Transcript_43432/g.114474 Transcript_43432/m.114474 type:complete len:252 (-) Transcript_43432:75-830(-)